MSWKMGFWLAVMAAGAGIAGAAGHELLARIRRNRHLEAMRQRILVPPHLRAPRPIAPEVEIDNLAHLPPKERARIHSMLKIHGSRWGRA